jgi:hypothetical protein
MRYLLSVFLLLSGCSGGVVGSSAQFTRQDMEQIKVGMTVSQTEAVLGNEYTTVMSIGNGKVCYWTMGEDDNVSSIIVTFTEGKVSEVAGTNLK